MLEDVGKTFGTILSIAAALGVLWAIWRFSLVQAQSRAIAAYKDVIDGLERRIGQLEEDAKQSTEAINKQEGEISMLRARLDAKDDTIQALYNAAVESAGCSRPDCPDRVIPGTTI